MAEAAMNSTLERVWDELERRRDELSGLVADLVRRPSLLGQEAEAQAYVADYLRGVGLEPDVWDLSPSVLDLPNAGNSGVPFDGRPNVAAVLRGTGGGRSLVLNGHIDVVSPEPVEAWTHDPWGAGIVGNRMYGRGACDMKSGLAINLFLAKVFRDLGIDLKGDLILQSVIEEECTGNGALDASRRYPADAAIVTEPTDGGLTQAHVGVIWFRVHVTGRAAHAAVAPTGVNAIVKAVPIIRALEDLDRRMNEDRHPAFADLDHPINLNIGVIRGGDWPSSVPGACELHCRLSFYPGQTVEEIRREVEEAIQQAAAGDEWLSEHPPTVSYDGFQSAGSVVPKDAPPVQMLVSWHKKLRGNEPRFLARTGTNDMRYYNFLGIPACCYGPSGGNLHAADEWLDLDSLVPTAKVLAAFICDWCGLAD